MSDPRFRIAVVCTGNICRSPLAAALLQDLLPEDQFEVVSGGVAHVPEGRVPSRQLRIAADLGVEGLTEHVAQGVSEDWFESAGLILGMSRRHRRFLVRKDPRATRRIFTLREFAYLASYATPADVERGLAAASPLAAAVEAVASLRGMVPPVETQEDFDIVDPYRRSRAVHRRSRDQLVPAAKITAEYLNDVVEAFGSAPKEVSLPRVEARPLRRRMDRHRDRLRDGVRDREKALHSAGH